MQFACALTSQTESEIVLLQLIEVYNPASLGAGFDNLPLGCDSYCVARDCARIAGQYGVPTRLQRMSYTTRADALAQAVDTLGATVLFAPMPPHRIGLLNRLAQWNLTHQLHGCRLYTLADHDAPDGMTPPVTLEMPQHAGV